MIIKSIKYCLLILMLLFAISAVSADGDFRDLNQSINNGDLNVNLTENYKFVPTTDGNFTNGITINKNHFVLDGQNHVIDGSNDARIFYITGDNVTIKNINLINGNSELHGGAINSIMGLTIINSTFTNNVAFSYGGAINADGSYLNVYDSTFISNNAEFGGAINTDNALTMNIYNSVFLDNGAMNEGAGLWSYNDINVINSTFINNVVGDIGGAIASENGEIYVNNSTFINNQAAFEGGAISAETGNIHLENSTFINNSGSEGGVVWTNGLTSYNSIFINNTATDSGGAISAIWAEIIGNYFKDNSAEDGEAIYISDDSAYPSIINYNVILESNPILNDDTNNILDVNYNWWGDNDDPENKISGSGIFNLTNYYIMNLTNNDTNFTIGESYKINYIIKLNNSADNNASLLPDFEIEIVYNDDLYKVINGKVSQIINIIFDDKINTISVFYNDIDIVNLTLTAYGLLIQVNDIIMYFQNGTRYTVTLIDTSNHVIANTNVTILINGMKTTITTNENGTASMALNLNPGEYDITALFEGNTEFNPRNMTTSLIVLPTIIIEDLTKFFRNGSELYVTLLDKQGNTVGNTAVSININGIIYNRTTNASGVAKLTIGLNPGNYTATATNPLDGLKMSSDVTILTTLIVDDLTKFFRNDSQYYVMALGSRGQPLMTNITININGVFYQRSQDDDGIATLIINLAPGTYIATAIHPTSGLQMSSTIIVLPTLIGTDLTKQFAEELPFEVKVLDGEGLPYEGRSISVNINGKLYEIISDENGIARLNINLNPGSYIATSSWNGMSTSNTITVNP